MSLLFCHIPKTAGTSFRKELERILPEDQLLSDYGENNPTTSLNLAERVRQVESERNWKVLCGHFPLSRYGTSFAPWQVAVFLREPRQQVVSHYEHQKRHQGYEGSLEDFALSSAGLGLQRRMLCNVPVQLLGFVGITAQYRTSLELFRHLFEIDVQPQELNINPRRLEENFDPRSVDIPASCRSLEQDEYHLFVQANRTLKARVNFIRDGGVHHWVFGAITHMDSQNITGVAFSKCGAIHLPLRILLNGEHLAFTCTGEDSPPMSAIRLPSKQCGFKLRLPKKLKARDRLEVRAMPSGQWIDTLDWHPNSKERHAIPPPPGELDVRISQA